MRRRSFVAGLSCVITCPFVATARDAAKVPVVGVLWHAGSPDEEQPFFNALAKGFSDLGYIDGQNIRLEHRFPNEVPDRFKSMLAELLALKVDVLVSISPASYYVRGATGATAHVFVMVPDPVRDHFVDSLAHPGGNATGLSLLSTDLTRKRVQLLREAVPGLSLAGLLVNPNIPVTPAIITEAIETADGIGLTLRVFQAPSLADLKGAFDAIANSGMQAVLVGAAGLFYQGKAIIGQLASEHRLPINVWGRELMTPGVFMGYGPSLAAIVQRAPTYVDRILKGAKPSELPVEQPTKLELCINLTVAKTLGIDVAPALLARADELIE